MQRIGRSLRESFGRFGGRATLVALASVVAVGTVAAVHGDIVNPSNRLAGLRLYVNEDSPARRQADAWRDSRPNDAALMDLIARQPVAKWMGNWNADVRRDAANVVSRASSDGAAAVFVAYNIPNRDCGSYSAGGSSSASAYRRWIREFAAGLGGGTSIVILEPDAVPGADCLPQAGREERFGLLRDAVQVLKSAHAVVYLDAGNSRWKSPAEVAARLREAGIDAADGFALNVSNYQSTAANVTYGDQLSKLVGGKHYIVDTSRNGAGGAGGQWCNVAGQALGATPTTNTGRALVDAYLWVKQPGESDGTCNGGPRAGAWWADYALGLARAQTVVASR